MNTTRSPTVDGSRRARRGRPLDVRAVGDKIRCGRERRGPSAEKSVAPLLPITNTHPEARSRAMRAGAAARAAACPCERRPASRTRPRARSSGSARPSRRSNPCSAGSSFNARAPRSRARRAPRRPRRRATGRDRIGSRRRPDAAAAAATSSLPSRFRTGRNRSGGETSATSIAEPVHRRDAAPRRRARHSRFAADRGMPVDDHHAATVAERKAAAAARKASSPSLRHEREVVEREPVRARSGEAHDVLGHARRRPAGHPVDRRVAPHPPASARGPEPLDELSPASGPQPNRTGRPRRARMARSPAARPAAAARSRRPAERGSSCMRGCRAAGDDPLGAPFARAAASARSSSVVPPPAPNGAPAAARPALELVGVVAEQVAAGSSRSTAAPRRRARSDSGDERERQRVRGLPRRVERGFEVDRLGLELRADVCDERRRRAPPTRRADGQRPIPFGLAVERSAPRAGERGDASASWCSATTQARKRRPGAPACVAELEAAARAARPGRRRGHEHAVARTVWLEVGRRAS